MKDLEAIRGDLEAELEAPSPSLVRLHPKLPELYRSKVAELTASLRDSEIKTRALDILRALIGRNVVRPCSDGGHPVLELEGALTAMLGVAQPACLAMSM